MSLEQPFFWLYVAMFVYVCQKFINCVKYVYACVTKIKLSIINIRNSTSMFQDPWKVAQKWLILVRLSLYTFIHVALVDWDVLIFLSSAESVMTVVMKLFEIRPTQISWQKRNDAVGSNFEQMYRWQKCTCLTQT